jgi:hypothetical protein
MDSLESALNHCLGSLTVALFPLPGSDSFVATIAEYPQCRGTGKSELDAMSAARRELNFIRDCRVAWAVEHLLGEAAAHPSIANNAPSLGGPSLILTGGTNNSANDRGESAIPARKLLKLG